jgi:NADPH:quinone reductase-like Zn-dependent oxidoreductase
MYKAGNLHGIFVGDRAMFEEMNRSVSVNRIRPVVDKIFPFDEAIDAYHHHASGSFVGKVVITI